MRQIILAINALLKFKAYTLINVLGLACSLACVLTVARYIHQENTVNQCFPEYKRICLNHIINFHINIGLSSKKGCTTESGGSNQKRIK